MAPDQVSGNVSETHTIERCLQHQECVVEDCLPRYAPACSDAIFFKRTRSRCRHLAIGNQLICPIALLSWKIEMMLAPFSGYWLRGGCMGGYTGIHCFCPLHDMGGRVRRLSQLLGMGSGLHQTNRRLSRHWNVRFGSGAACRRGRWVFRSGELLCWAQRPGSATSGQWCCAVVMH